MTNVALGTAAAAVARPSNATMLRRAAGRSIRSTAADDVIDEIAELEVEILAADDKIVATQTAFEEAEWKLPQWMRGLPRVDATMPGENTWRRYFGVGKEIELAELRALNERAADVAGWNENLHAARAALLATGETDAAASVSRMVVDDTAEERTRLRAEGRARVRWWIAARRKQDAARDAAGVTELERAVHEAEAEREALCTRAISTRARSVVSALAKLRIAGNEILERSPGGGFSAPDYFGKKVLLSTIEDLERLARETLASSAA